MEIRFRLDEQLYADELAKLNELYPGVQVGRIIPKILTEWLLLKYPINSPDVSNIEGDSGEWREL